MYRLRRYDHITDVITLHWLRLPERVDLKVAVMAYRVLHGLAPPYLSPVAAQPSSTPFFFDASAARSTIPFVNCRSSFFSRRRGHTLEHTAGGCPVFPFTSGLPPASEEDIPLPQIIS